jgi:DNA polymerase III sliding clamp (beta) subunit (PCNA family)
MLSGIGDVAIAFTTDDKGEVKVQGGRTTIRLRSLDPSKYPYWDKTLTSAEVTGSVSSGSLLAGLGYSKRFVSPEDTTRPEIAQVEAMGDFVWSSDRRAVSMVKIGGLTDTHLRVSGKDLPAVLKFLALGDETIEVLESDSSVIFRRGDGAHVGASRPNAQFPSLKVDDVVGTVRFTLAASDLRAAINVLSASARKDNERTRISAKNGNIVLSMECEAGGEDQYEISPVSASGLDEFPTEGFSVDYPHVLGFVEHFSLDTLPLEIHRKGKGGYVAFRRGTSEGDTDTNSYFSVVVWRT